tara:strand:+ start:103 stop:630 length:528 start_codon:yes stop_codon:yes gene_type:complete
MSDSVEQFLYEQIVGILQEQEEEVEQTGKRRRGRYKAAAESPLALENPAELMRRLKVGKASGKDDITKLFNFVKQAVSGVEAMSDVYSNPVGKKHPNSGRQGVRVSYTILDERNARRFMEWTVLAGTKSGLLPAMLELEGKHGGTYGKGESLQIESLGGDILVYFAPKRNTWHIK